MMEAGVGRAHGAVSVLNAIATGIGGAVGIDVPVEARVRLSGDAGRVVIESRTPWGRVTPPRELSTALLELAREMGHSGGLEVEVYSRVPPASGLKSSSALVNSITLGLADALGVEMSLEEAARLGVTVSRRAGLTLTDAYDDSLATLLPGVFITDNWGLRILRRFTFDETLYAVAAVPPTGRPIQAVEPGVFESLGRHYSRAVDLALEGRWMEAMAVNAVLTLVATGLDEWSIGLVARALEHEATLLAGVSGKGPSVYALTTDPRGVADAWGEAGVEVIVARLLGGGR